MFEIVHLDTEQYFPDKVTDHPDMVDLIDHPDKVGLTVLRDKVDLIVLRDMVDLIGHPDKVHVTVLRNKVDLIDHLNRAVENPNKALPEVDKEHCHLYCHNPDILQNPLLD